MDRTITVTSRGLVSAPAEITVVRLKISGMCDEFKYAAEGLAKATAKIRDAAEKAGIDRSLVKTSKLDVTQHFSRIPRDDGRGRIVYDEYDDVPDGFVYSQTASFEFPNDSGKLSRAVFNIMNTDVKPKITFGFRTSDPERYSREALAKAVDNARKEAEIIALGSGSRLGALAEAVRGGSGYPRGRGRDMFESDLEDCCFNSMPEEPDFDIDPEDEVFSESVTMTWVIE